MSHIPIALAAYFFNALAVLSSKFLLKKIIPDPLIYIFYISLVSLLALFALPFTNIPNLEVFSLASASTLLWTLAAYLMYKALKIAPVSRVIPIIGTLIPLILLITASQNSSLAQNQIHAILVLILGMVFLTITDWQPSLQSNDKKLNKTEVIYEVASAVFFAISYIILRQAYAQFDFFSTIVWSRLILLPVGIIILAQPALRLKIITPSGPKLNLFSKNGLIFSGGQISGVISEFLLLFAISLANPALVNSLQGSQYVFLLFFALILSRKYPSIFQEKYTSKILAIKFIGIALIGAGLYLLAAVKY